MTANSTPAILSGTKYPSVLLLNSRSLYYKVDELRILVSNMSPDVVGVTESWLSDDIPDFCLAIDDYILFRADRTSRSGGGVCIYVRKSFKPSLLASPSIDGIEYAIIRLVDVQVIFICLYIPPNLPASLHRDINEILISLYDDTLDAFPSSKFIFCGDFNDYNTSVFHSNLSCINRVTSPTRGNSFLDQIWISEQLEINYPHAAEVAGHTMKQAKSMS